MTQPLSSTNAGGRVMTDAQALFILDLLCVMAGCYKRTVRPARWSVRNSDGVIVVRIYEQLK